MKRESYAVREIDRGKMEKLIEDVDFSSLAQRKASIHGTCIKLFCTEDWIIQMWEDNFYPMGVGMRPHGRIIVLKDKSRKLKVCYERISKTVIIYNCDYYGWIKSIALALAADYLMDSPSLENRRYSIHGSYLDIGGRGIGIMGKPKAGKTTLTYGMLDKREDVNFLTDDWFFIRFMGMGTRIYSAEENSYAGTDIAENWPQLKKRLAGAKRDSHGRAIVDIKRLFGAGRIRDRSECYGLILLTRDKKESPIRELAKKEAVELLEKWDYCNPHQLYRGKERMQEQKRFFSNLLKKVPIYLLNTVETPEQSLKRLEEIVEKLD
jgi:hypothetical protein